MYHSHCILTLIDKLDSCHFQVISIERVDKNFKKYIFKQKFTLQTENRINPCPKTKEERKKTQTLLVTTVVCVFQCNYLPPPPKKSISSTWVEHIHVKPSVNLTRLRFTVPSQSKLLDRDSNSRTRVVESTT